MRDGAEPTWPERATAVLSLVVGTVAILVTFILYGVTDGFGAGMLRDLPAHEAQVIDDLRSAGIIAKDASTGCSWEPQVIVKVGMDWQRGEYCVRGLVLGPQLDVDKLAPFLPRLNGLRKLITPHCDHAGQQALAARFPQYEVAVKP